MKNKNQLVQAVASTKHLTGVDSALGYTLGGSAVQKLLSFRELNATFTRLGWIKVDYMQANYNTYLGVVNAVCPVQLTENEFVPCVNRYDYVNKDFRSPLPNPFMSGSYTMHAKGGGNAEVITGLPMMSTDGGFFSPFEGDEITETLVSCAGGLGKKAFNLALMPLANSVSSYSAASASDSADEAAKVRADMHTKLLEAVLQAKLSLSKQFDVMVFGFYSDMNIVKSDKFNIPGVYLNMPSFVMYVRPCMLNTQGTESVKEKISKLSGISNFVVPITGNVVAPSSTNPGINVESDLVADVVTQVKANANAKQKAVNSDVTATGTVDANDDQETPNPDTVSGQFGKLCISKEHEAAFIYAVAINLVDKNLPLNNTATAGSLSVDYLKTVYKQFFAGNYDNLKVVKAVLLDSGLLASKAGVFTKAYNVLSKMDAAAVGTLLQKASTAGTTLTKAMAKAATAPAPTVTATENVKVEPKTPETPVAKPTDVFSVVTSIWATPDSTSTTATTNKTRSGPKGRGTPKHKSLGDTSTTENVVVTPTQPPAASEEVIEGVATHAAVGTPTFKKKSK